MLAGSGPAGGLQPPPHLREDSTASCGQPLRLLESMEENFFRLVTGSPA